jgi:signal transduction histidine kinase
MNQSVVLLDKRNSELHEVFNSIKTSCILYDLFGRVLLVNKYMEEFAQSVNLRLFNITMLEFIVEITGNNVDYARNLLQQIIFDHESISIPVIHGAMNRSYMLHMRPLKNQDERIQDELIPDESQVFQISGVLCELVDMTELKSLYQLKEKMFERFSFQVRNDLSSILFGLSILDDQQSSKDEKQFVLENIQGKVDETLNMLEVVKKQMDVEIESMVTHTLLCYPVDGRLPLQRAVAQLKNRLEQREINIHLQLPELISLVFASPQELEVVLHAVLLAMIEDTYEAGEIWIEVEEKEQNVFYHIYNKGIGISDNKLQTFEESGLTEESEILKFHYAIRCVNRWGGSLNITSQMGEGSRAELLLRRFM